MKKQYVVAGLLFCFAVFSNTSVSAEKVVTDVAGFEKMVQKWVDLRTELRSEGRDWKERKEGMEREIKLFTKEKEQLRKEIKDMRTEMTNAQKEQADSSLQLERNQKTLDSLTNGLERAEKRLLSSLKLLPESLSGGFKKNLRALTNVSSMSVTQRAQNVLSIYSEIGCIQASVHLTRELIEMDDGQKKEFDVVYLGLAQAFCVSSDGGSAGIGKPGTDGWHWQWDDSLVKKNNVLVKTIQQKKAAEFVVLPLFAGEEIL